MVFAIMILSIINFSFFFYSSFQKTEKYLEEKLKDYVRANSLNAVYLIKKIDTYCRPCTELEQLKEKNAAVVFFVDKDFSDQDIENLREAFHMTEEYPIARENSSIEKVYKKINKETPSFAFNYLIIFNERRKVEEIRRF